MPLQIFFNDLSSQNAPAGHPAAVTRLRTLVQVVRAARREFGDVVFNAQDRLDDLDLGGEIYLAGLRNTADCREEASFLKTVTDRSPLGLSTAELEGPVDEEFEYRLEAAAFVLPGEVAVALGLSHRYVGLALSLDTHAFWRQDTVTLDRSWLDDAATLQVDKASAINACTHEQLTGHAPLLRQGLTPHVENGADLWARREELFPNLRFISRTRQQLEDLKAGDLVLDNVVEALTGLDQAIGRWAQTGANHPTYPFSVKPESKSRKALTQFHDDDGVTREFSDHCRFSPIEGRIHFILETEPRRHALVGHVARKLGIG